MIRKLALIFIKYIPFIFILDLLLKLFLFNFSLSILAICFVDSIEKLFVLSGFIIFSFTFKFCIYHRLFLYFLTVLYITYAFISLNGFEINSLIYLDISTFIFIFLISLIIAFRNKYGNI